MNRFRYFAAGTRSAFRFFCLGYPSGIVRQNWRDAWALLLFSSNRCFHVENGLVVQHRNTA